MSITPRAYRVEWRGDTFMIAATSEPAGHIAARLLLMVRFPGDTVPYNSVRLSRCPDFDSWAAAQEPHRRLWTPSELVDSMGDSPSSTPGVDDGPTS